jgi:3'-phosphoadenosine 5'-phosphosulfate sulfotransferase (PAPS reductase)/FAD synthetase
MDGMKPKTAPHGGKHCRPRKNKENVYTYDQLKEWQAWPLKEKAAWAKDAIERFLAKVENPSVAFSAGKDSTVLLHLVRQFRPDVNVIYGNTTIEFPECVRFAHRLRDGWNLNYHEAIPDVRFWWIVREYGWPLLGKSHGVGGVAHKTSRAQFFERLKEEHGELPEKYRLQAKVPISSACCTFLKERPSIKLQKKLGVDGVFLGILAAESRRRMFNFLEYGEIYYPKSQRVWKCHPLAIWDDDDIWAYIRKYNVPYAPLYDMGFTNEYGRWVSHKRNGCMFCGMDLKYPDNHFAIMRHTHPKAWRTVMVKMGLGQVLLKLHHEIYRQYDLFADVLPLEEYLDKFPCAFDRI